MLVIPLEKGNTRVIEEGEMRGEGERRVFQFGQSFSS